MLKLFAVTFMAAVLFSCNSPKQSSGSDQLMSEEKNEGWRFLFDGKSTKGWHKYGNMPVGSAWKVKEGYLYLDTADKNAGDIVTDEEFDNFHLRLEWKISKNGNSGIFLFVEEDKAKYNWPWETGLEMQVLDNDGHPDGKIKTHHAGDLFDLMAGSKEIVKPVGEWNLAEVKCLNGKLELYLNGENVVSTILWDDNWKKMVVASKFRNMPGFGTYKKGRIGLQDHGDEVSFRNIKIRRL